MDSKPSTPAKISSLKRVGCPRTPSSNESGSGSTFRVTWVYRRRSRVEHHLNSSSLAVSHHAAPKCRHCTV